MALIHPQSIITLKTARAEDKSIWVTESPVTVISMKETARNQTDMVELTRWRGGETSTFHTQAGNIISVEAYH